MNNQVEQGKYFITYCVMDSSAGANPLGHAFLFLSKTLENGSIEVVNTMGFYSQPTSTTQPVIKALKTVLGVKYDLQDVHGQFIHEKMREINHNGLTGKSFSLDAQAFEAHNTRFNEIIDSQKTTIEELNTQLSLLEKHGYDQSFLEKIVNDEQLIKEHQPKILELLQNYQQGSEELQKQKHNGYKRFLLEKILHPDSQEQRLKGFHLQLDFGLFGPDTTASLTCKDRAVNYLYDTGVINENEKAQFRNTYRALAPFPCSSGVKLSPIRLQSTKPLHPDTSRTGMKYFNPHFADELKDDEKPLANQLYWVTSPNEEMSFEMRQNTISVLNDLKKVQTDLYNTGSDFDELKARVEDKMQLFTNASQNKAPDYLQQKIAETHQFLNAVHLKLNPELLDQSFLLRVYYDLHMRKALMALSLIGLSVWYVSAAPAAIIIPIITYASYVIAAASLYYGMMQTYAFIQKESSLPQMKQDYQVEFAPGVL